VGVGIVDIDGPMFRIRNIEDAIAAGDLELPNSPIEMSTKRKAAKRDTCHRLRQQVQITPQ